MPRRDFNVKKKLREEEESIDAVLKGADLWEEELSLVQKRRLVKFIAESKSSAEEEEEHRRKYFSLVDSTSIDQDITEVKDAQVDDFDPVITYESPTTLQNRKQVVGREPISQKNCINSNNTLREEAPHSSTHSQNKNLSSSSNTGILECVKSRLSEKFIEISSTSDHPNTSTDMENFIVSESDDETTQPQIINSIGDKLSNDCDDIEEVFQKREKEKTVSKSLDINEPSSSHDNSSIETCTIASNHNSNNQVRTILNKSHSKTQMEINDKSIPSSSKEEQSHSLEQELNCISLENCVKTSEENIVKINKQVESKMPDKCILEDMALTTKKDSHSDFSNGQLKHRLRNEKPNLAFFKSPYETDTKCVKRICSLITEWQSAFAKHQRSLNNPCKWGIPICVDRKVDDLIKNLNHRPARTFVADVIYDSDATESDFHVSDQSSEEEWEIFPHKKKKTKSKKPTTFRRNNITKGSNNIVRELDTNYDGKSTKKIKLQKRTQIIEPAATISSSNLGIEAPFDAQKDSYSSDGIWIDSVSKSKNVNPYKFYKKSGRKTFQLTPDENQESMEIEESNSNELPDICISKNSTPEEITSQQCILSLKKNSSLSVSTFAKTPTDPLKADNDDKRVNLKRKGDSDSLSVPPYKKSTSEISKDLSKPTTSDTSRHKDIKGYDSQNISSFIESQDCVPQKENNIQESRSKEVNNAIQNSLNSIEEDEKMDTSSKEDSTVECPLCQFGFPVEEIEAHASECNGLVEHTQNQEQQGPSTSTGESSSRSKYQSYKSISEQTSDVLYLGTRSQFSHPRN